MLNVLLKQWQLIWWFITQFWWMFPPIAVIMWFILMQIARTVINRVLYIRKGGTMSFHNCVIEGTNIKFRPEKKRGSHTITVYQQAQPYTYVKGMSTMRVYVVLEGGGKTVGFEGLGGKEKGSAMAAAASMSLFERYTTHLAEHLPKTKVQYLMIILYVGMGVMVGLGWGFLGGRLGWI